MEREVTKGVFTSTVEVWDSPQTTVEAEVGETGDVDGEGTIGKDVGE